LPSRFHCIRHFGLKANTERKKNVDRVRQLLNVREKIGKRLGHP